MSIIAENVKKIIEDKGVKHCVIAKRAGYSRQKFSAMLNGRKIIEGSDVIRLANALDVTPNDICGFNSN